jgi:hypothetical protein
MSRIIVVPLLLSIFVMCPTQAYAQLDYLWDWGERFVGPGPWNGHSFIMRFHCGKMMAAPQEVKVSDIDKSAPEAERNQTAFEVVRFQRDPRDPNCRKYDADNRIKAYWELRSGFRYTGGLFWNHDPIRFGDSGDTRKVWALVVEPFVMARVSPVLDVGGGAGYIYFMGEGFNSFGRWTTTPLSLLISPLSAFKPHSQKLRWLQFRFDVNYMPQGLDANDEFGDDTSQYHMDVEWTRRAGIIIDFWALFNRYVEAPKP